MHTDEPWLDDVAKNRRAGCRRARWWLLGLAVVLVVGCLVANQLAGWYNRERQHAAQQTAIALPPTPAPSSTPIPVPPASGRPLATPAPTRKP